MTAVAFWVQYLTGTGSGVQYVPTDLDGTPVLTSRAVIIDGGSGFSAPATTTGTNNNFPCLFETSPGEFALVWSDHDGLVINYATCSGDPLVKANWTIHAAGTGISGASLATLAGYSSPDHLGSPEVVETSAGNFTMFVHARFGTGPSHHTFALTGTDFTAGEGVGWAWANSGAALSTANNIYLRSFQYGGTWYGVSDSAKLLVGPTVASAADGVGTYTPVSDLSGWRGGILDDDVRHSGALVDGTRLLVAYTRTLEYEHIRFAAADLSVSSDPEDWALVNVDLEIWPYLTAEGTDLPYFPSASGTLADTRQRALRDPQMYRASTGVIYMLWAGAGEDVIVIADATDLIEDTLAALPF